MTLVLGEAYRTTYLHNTRSYIDRRCGLGVRISILGNTGKQFVSFAAAFVAVRAGVVVGRWWGLPTVLHRAAICCRAVAVGEVFVSNAVVIALKFGVRAFFGARCCCLAQAEVSS